MSRVLPYPLFSLAMVVMWMMLTRFSLGHLLLGSLIAVGAGRAMSALQPSRVRIRNWHLLARLLLVVTWDIVRSNIAVAGLILSGGRHGRRRSGFVDIPLALRDPTALTILAIIITATPGTAWIEYDSNRGHLLIHVFDLIEPAEWVELIKTRYEHMLMEVFE